MARLKLYGASLTNVLNIEELSLDIHQAKEKKLVDNVILNVHTLLSQMTQVIAIHLHDQQQCLPKKKHL